MLLPPSVEGSGKRGQVLKEDVSGRHRQGSLRSVSCACGPGFGAPCSLSAADDQAREERVKMTRLRQTIAKRLKDAQNTAAMLTTYNEVDMSAVMDLRNRYKDLFEKKHGVKLGFMGFFTKAVTHALKEIPAVNAESRRHRPDLQELLPMSASLSAPTRVSSFPMVRDADQMSHCRDREGNRPARQGCPRWCTVDGRHAGRHFHHL